MPTSQALAVGPKSPRDQGVHAAGYSCLAKPHHCGGIHGCVVNYVEQKSDEMADGHTWDTMCQRKEYYFGRRLQRNHGELILLSDGSCFHPKVIVLHHVFKKHM